MADQCQFCGFLYGSLIRIHRNRNLFCCRHCLIESCDECVKNIPMGPMTRLLSCPNCGGEELTVIDLLTRYTIFTPLEHLQRFPRSLLLPFLAASQLVHRTEHLAVKAMPKLSSFQPQLVLMDETMPENQTLLSQWYPERFNASVGPGNGSLIWLRHGVPVAISVRGQFLTEADILMTSQLAW